MLFWTKYKDADSPNKHLYVVKYNIALLMQQYFWIGMVFTNRENYMFVG